MSFLFDETRPALPFVELVWRTRSEQTEPFISRAVSQWELNVTRYQGKTTLTVMGPETKATLAQGPADAEFFGIKFKLGTLMPHLPVSGLVNGALTLPEARRNAFWLKGSAVQIPDFDHADVFTEKLVKAGLLVRDPLVDAALRGEVGDLSPRTVQRRFLKATGLTLGTVRQIERARLALELLEQGTAIADVVFQTGYADQPHLTRALKTLLGQTPAQILRANVSG